MTHVPKALLDLPINTIHLMSNEQESSFASRATKVSRVFFTSDALPDLEE